MVISAAYNFGRGKLACKSMKIAYKIVICGLVLSTIALLPACSGESGWGTGLTPPDGETGNSPPATMEGGFTRATPAQ